MESNKSFLCGSGGETSNMFYFHLSLGFHDPIWLYNIDMVFFTTN